MRAKNFTIITSLFLIIFNLIIFSAEHNRNSTDVMLQGFHWESHKTSPWWQVIQNKAKTLSDMGIDIVWLPPSAKSADIHGYLPNEYLVQNSAYGNSHELQSAIRALKNNGIKVLADIVINHRVGTYDWADFTNPYWGPDAVCANDEWPGAKGNWDTGYGYHAARDIDHLQEYVRKSIVDYMNTLKNTYGYDGWRYDFVKGFHGKFVDYYNKNTNPYISVGEYWTDLNIHDYDSHRQELCDWVVDADTNTAVFDFTTKGLLQYAVKNNNYYKMKDYNGRPSGLLGWWPQKSVTFIDNHDTGPSTGGGQNHWPFPHDKILLGYTYILTHPGIPCVYWVHLFDWGEYNQKIITELIKIRKKYGIHSESDIRIMAADNSKYAAVIDNKLAMKIGPGTWAPGSEYKLLLSGTDFAVWAK